MKPMTIIVILWMAIVFGYAFLHHDRLYDIMTLITFINWTIISVVFLVMHEIEGVPWPWAKGDA